MSHEACQDVIRKATTYINRLTRDWPRETIQDAIRASATRAAVASIDHAACAQDVTATQSACRHWWTLIRTYQSRQGKGENATAA